MSEASYDRQHLALHAAGFISASGATAVTFGCTMTRIQQGRYAMILDASAGVVADESYIVATAKVTENLTGNVTLVDDTSDTVKTVEINQAGSDPDYDVEIILFKTVTR